MAAVAWLLPPVALGCLLAYRFGGIARLEPRWAAWLLVLGAGIAGGSGLVSCIFFLSRLLLPSAPALPMLLELAALAVAAYLAWRPSAAPQGTPAQLAGPWSSVLGTALLAALVVITVAVSGAWEANPHGYWDALSTWNLRARFLAADGALAERAWSAAAPVMHGDYPLLTGALIARCWMFGGAFTAAVPQLVSYLFLLGLILLLTGAIAVLRGSTIGLLAGLTLTASPKLLHETPAQYADVPLACYFAGAILFGLLDSPVAAGLFAGFAAWTKDEGLVFCAILIGVTIVFKRRAALRVAAGALPAVAIDLAFKVWVAQENSLYAASGAGLTHKIADPSRYIQVGRAFAEQLVSLGSGWYHPVLPLVVLWFALRWNRDYRRDLWYCAAISGALLAAYFGTYIITPVDLSWQLQTSVQRLFVQMWPSLLICAFVSMRPPHAAPVPAPVAVRKKSRRKA